MCISFNGRWRWRSLWRVGLKVKVAGISSFLFSISKEKSMPYMSLFQEKRALLLLSLFLRKKNPGLIPTPYMGNFVITWNELHSYSFPSHVPLLHSYLLCEWGKAIWARWVLFWGVSIYLPSSCQLWAHLKLHPPNGWRRYAHTHIHT